MQDSTTWEKTTGHWNLCALSTVNSSALCNQYIDIYIWIYHQCMVLVLKPLESHKIQQALSFHALLCDSIMPLHGVRQREKQQHVKSDPWSSLLAPDSLHQCSGKTWDTWERFALQIILDLEYRFTHESLPNSQTLHKQVCINWKTDYFLFILFYMSCDKRALKASVHRIKAVDENMFSQANGRMQRWCWKGRAAIISFNQV